MLHSRTLNNRINRLHERALRIAYSDYNTTFQELLVRDGSFTIHERNIQILAIQIFKFLHGMSPKIMEGVFKLKDTTSESKTNSIAETQGRSDMERKVYLI